MTPPCPLPELDRETEEARLRFALDPRYGRELPPVMGGPYGQDPYHPDPYAGTP